MVREVGGEFWKADVMNVRRQLVASPHELLLSGRTALDFIIKDIKSAHRLQKVYMPSYCCSTMIQPFIDNSVKVDFYRVGFENGKYSYDIDFHTKCDAVLIMQYFGYCNRTVEEAIESFNKLEKVIIEDATHSWFSKFPYSFESDYVFASFRKWTGVACGAVAIKQKDRFNVSVQDETNYEFINMRQQAATLKKGFIEKNEDNKETFLSLFDQAENLLETDYHNYSIPKKHKDIITRIDEEKIKTARQINAVYLVEGLKGCCEVEVITIDSRDTPLFVPIIVHNGMRDKLRQHLIDNHIYCPAHWPVTMYHNISCFDLYNNSLSLVCDQRYSILDMQRIISSIHDFYKKGL